jgi:hypothetical protein
MLKFLIFLVGLAGGAGGVTAWLLSEPSPAGGEPSSAGTEQQPQIHLRTSASPRFVARDDLQKRLDDLKVRWSEALAEGRRAGQETEERLRRELDADRKGQTQPAAR